MFLKLMRGENLYWSQQMGRWLFCDSLASTVNGREENVRGEKTLGRKKVGCKLARDAKLLGPVSR
jgi:hypothetical protein